MRLNLTFVYVSSESADHYFFHWPGHLTDDQIQQRLLDQLGEELEHCYIEHQEYLEFD